MTDRLSIIPTPKGWWRCGENTFVETKICGDFDAAQKTFCRNAAKAGFDFAAGEGGVYVKCESALGDREYKLCVSDGKVTIAAGSETAAHYALATLLQLCRKYEDKLLIDCVTVTDCPDCDYRSLLIDCARSLHPVAQMKQYIDMCWLYKVRYLHIHFTDDEAWALPSKVFDKLPTEGRHFTFEEIAELCSYAAENGIQLVPEVDSPGHCTALQKAYPEIFGTQGILKFTKASIESMSKIYREVCEMFADSEYIHIGGDESRLGWWIGDKECEEYGRQFGYNPEDEGPGMSSNEYLMLRYLAHFIAENAKTVISCGKKPIVWDGFHKVTNDMIPKDVTVTVFDSSYQLASSLVADGFKVINCSWLPTYVVTPTWCYSERDCFNWDIFSFGTINEQSPYANGMMHMPETKMIIGGQLSSWGDSIEKAFPSPEAGRADELSKIRRRLPYISENTWNKARRTDFDGISEALSVTDKLLSKIIGE